MEANCQYRGAAHFDDLLHVHARISHIGDTGFEFSIFKQLKDELIATSRNIVIAVDIKTEKPIRVSDELRNAVAPFEGEAI